MRLWPFLLAMIGSAAAADAGASTEPYAPRVGHRHPDFTLPAISDGKPVTLSDFRGRKVLLIQFASW